MLVMHVFNTVVHVVPGEIFEFVASASAGLCLCCSVMLASHPGCAATCSSCMPGTGSGLQSEEGEADSSAIYVIM